MASMSQFLPLASVRRLLEQHKVDDRYKKRARNWLLFSCLLEPLRWYEQLRYRRRIRETQLYGDPVFLLGFGRSGTTHLHNLFHQDPQFGVVSTYQSVVHPIALMGRNWLPGLFASRLPTRRPMDNVAISLDGPQEEEMAMINCTDHAPLHVMNFPRAIPELYDRYVSNLGEDQQAFEGWRRGYMEVLKKATILSGGKRLALKTPPNTARIRVLLEMFPDARFVNIVRNPYPVYQSMRNMYRKMLPGSVLQEFEWEDIDAWIVHAYRVQMQSYLEQRNLIPPGHLVEIRYEDLDVRPVSELEKIYKTLELGDFEVVRPLFERYLESLGSYEKNRFDFPPEIVNTVNENWGFAFEAFGYDRMPPRPISEPAIPETP
ncbi:MAG: sulfotransferase [Myxococcales bacterium]|nr:sulfotransferase [Myxococcales bacterium]